MAATSGRAYTIEKGGTVIAGIRENSLSFDGSPVDITTKDDNGFRTLGDFSGVKSFEISFSGLIVDAVIEALALTPGGSLLLDDVTVTLPSGATIAGDVFLASFESTGAHDGANEGSGTLQSSGAWTYTPAA